MTPCMENSFNMLDFLPYIALLVSVSGWFAAARLTHRYNLIESKKSEINRKIDELHVVLFDIRDELLGIMESNKHTTTSNYFRLVSFVSHISFICESIEELDIDKKVNATLMKKIRQSCTNDKNYKPEKISYTLYKFELISMEIKKHYKKSFD